jgi:hypothetical protein
MPVKKTMKKAVPKPTPKGSGKTPYERNALPSKGGTCQHTDRCFLVRLEGCPGNDTYHWFDEGGAVIFAMRETRNHGWTANVYGPDRKLICTFKPRTYDVAKYTHSLTNYNEDLQLSIANSRDTLAKRKTAATSASKPTKTLTKKRLTK